MKLFLYCALILTFACSFKNSHLEKQNLKGHEELYSEPSEKKLLDLAPSEKRIVIASTNDVHGNYKPTLINFKDDHQNKLQNIRVGGVDVMKSYFDILRDQFKNVILVDSGDILSNASSLKKVSKFYSFLDYDALTLGLRDFNLKVPEKVGSSAELFQKFSKSSKVPLILSNLYELKTARVVEWKGTKSHIIKDVNGVKVGIVGLIPEDIAALTPVNNRVGLFVESMLQSTLRHARLLRSLGADLIVVLAHQGMDCASDLADKSRLPPMKVNFDPARKGVCDLKSPMGQYLERLPPNLIDVVIGGRTEQKMANFVNGILLMSGYADGKSFNFAEFVINTKTREIVQSKTIVHQPILFCHEFFKETNDCFSEDPSVNHEKRIPATFLGKPIERDLKLEKRFPGLSEDNTAKAPKASNASHGLVTFDADISYAPESSGESQLIVISIKGRELAQILEEDFNLKRELQWQPSPFTLKD
jgi:2',3'-cyclic-nucleotide 2'-phosphodiesterase (5'-nucleotidase family)